jgi:hypothetical protein
MKIMHLDNNNATSWYVVLTGIPQLGMRKETQWDREHAERTWIMRS